MMTQAAIIKGAARWFAKAIATRLAPYGASRLIAATAVKLAENDPQTALTVLSGKSGTLANILTALTNTPESFETIVQSLREAIAGEKLKLRIPEIGLGGILPAHEFSIDAQELEAIVAEVRKAAAE